MPDRCSACVAARCGHMEVTANIDLDTRKYKGSLIFGSAYNILGAHWLSGGVLDSRPRGCGF